MSGLREALEELLRDRESNQGAGPSDYVIAPYELRELLAAHPVQPPLRRMAVIGVLEHYNFSVWQPKTYEIADAIIAALSTSGEVKPGSDDQQ